MKSRSPLHLICYALLFRFSAIALGLLLGLWLAEATLRLTTDNASTFGTPIPCLDVYHSEHTTVEWGLGYRPKLDHLGYDRYGTQRVWTGQAFVPPYPYSKSPGKIRLLFVGDSVTARGSIINGLKGVYGEKRYEYWNAGVEGYNTAQEFLFYQKYNQHLDPDAVILTFHNNDFGTTPVVIRNDEGKLVSYEPGRPVNTLNSFLFQHSILYRYWVAFHPTRTKELSVEETTWALKGFQNLLPEKKIAFAVLLMPILEPYGQWSDYEKLSRKEAIAAFRRLHIRYFDLLPALERALSQGIDCLENPNDNWHPGILAGEVFARYLKEQGLFEGLAPIESSAENP